MYTNKTVIKHTTESQFQIVNTYMNIVDCWLEMDVLIPNHQDYDDCVNETGQAIVQELQQSLPFISYCLFCPLTMLLNKNIRWAGFIEH